MPVGQLDEQLISYVARYGSKGLRHLTQAGIGSDFLVDEFRTAWRYITRMKRDHNTVPGRDMLMSRFPDLELPRVREADLPVILHDLRKRKKFHMVLEVLEQAGSQVVHGWDEIDGVVATLQAEINKVNGYNDTESKHLVDLFHAETKQRMVKEMKKRRKLAATMIPSGLDTFDAEGGGLQRQRMVTIIGRTGQGKSWLNLLFVRSAVIAGHKVILYPLEMSLYETAARLYTLFSAHLWGGSKTLKNFDLNMGQVTVKQMMRFLDRLENEYAGKLYLADTAHLYDPYTPEKIEAEVQLLKPDMFWVDYLTLMRNANSKGANDWNAIQELSSSIKSIAMRNNVVGGCSAQVNREAIKGAGNNKLFLPRLENISYGDSIGQDSDQVFSIIRPNERFMYYSLVKNRLGPEIGRTKVHFDVNLGILKEARVVEGEEEGAA